MLETLWTNNIHMDILFQQQDVWSTHQILTSFCVCLNQVIFLHNQQLIYKVYVYIHLRTIGIIILYYSVRKAN